MPDLRPTPNLKTRPATPHNPLPPLSHRPNDELHDLTDRFQYAGLRQGQFEWLSGRTYDPVGSVLTPALLLSYRVSLEPLTHPLADSSGQEGEMIIEGLIDWWMVEGCCQEGELMTVHPGWAWSRPSRRAGPALSQSRWRAEGQAAAGRDTVQVTRAGDADC